MSEFKDPATGTSSPSKNCRLFGQVASLLFVILLLMTIFLPKGENPYLRAGGVFILTLAAIFIFLPFYFLSKYGRVGMGDSYMQTRQVVDRGPYAIVRHPQYLGYVLLACGFAFLRQHWTIILLTVLGSVFFYLQAVEDEAICISKFGEAYRQYCQRVPRFNFILGLIRVLIRSSGG